MITWYLLAMKKNKQRVGQVYVLQQWICEQVTSLSISMWMGSNVFECIHAWDSQYYLTNKAIHEKSENETLQKISRNTVYYLYHTRTLHVHYSSNNVQGNLQKNFCT